MVNVAVLACVLRATSKKRSSTISRKVNCTREKILASPMVTVVTAGTASEATVFDTVKALHTKNC